MRTWLRGVALLRFPALVRDLGERRMHLEVLAAIERAFPGARLNRDVRLVSYEPGRLDLSNGVRIQGGTVLAFGDGLNGFGRIIVGERTWVGEYNNLRAGGGDIRIGQACLISQFCTLAASNHAAARGRPIQEQGADAARRGIVIADDVWLGAGVCITAGVAIGTGAVVAAGSVVTRDVPAYEVWGGVPARKMGERQ